MEDKICVINQSCGIGDILYCQKIAVKYQEKGYHIIWGIKKSILFIVDYIKQNNIEYVEISDVNKKIHEYNFNNIITLNLNLPAGNGCRIMERKYKEARIDSFSDWYKYVRLNRNIKKEKELMYYLGITKGMKYSLINRNYGTPPNYLKHNFKCSPKYKIIDMDFIPNFNLFDWCSVLENATEIFTIDTCINLLIETLSLKTEELHTWSRRKDFSEVDYFFNLNWVYHC